MTFSPGNGIKEHKSSFHCTHICFWIGIIQRFIQNLLPQKSRTPLVRKCRFIACTVPWAHRAHSGILDLVVRHLHFKRGEVTAFCHCTSFIWCGKNVLIPVYEKSVFFPHCLRNSPSVTQFKSVKFTVSIN